MATPMPLAARASAERRFFLGMALALFAAVFVGFSRSFFLRPLFPEWHSPSETIFYIHGAAYVGWIVLLVTQASLVTARRTDLHRIVGPFGVGLAAVMVVLGTLSALVAAHRPTGFIGIPVPPLQFLAIPIADMILFTLFVGLAIAKRRNAQNHKRYMLLGTIGLVTAAIARWPGIYGAGPLWFFGLTDLFLVAMAIWDFRSLGKLHPVTLWGGLVLILSQPLRLLVSGTDWWMSFARWATGLLN